ncbi:PglD-related sugar-binding protein [Alishewanella sp. HL-SH06]|uniref:PglD-related sugar-binding protein n=1 Tax=Alishewanella sp. HL-SH06 TaxID=3461144 RepID=UPI0040411E04
MSHTALLIIGVGGFGRSVAEAAMLSGKWGCVDFVDDSYPHQQLPAGYNVIGHSADLPKFLSKYTGVVVAIGNNQVRSEKLASLAKLGAPIVNIYHPRAFVSEQAEVGLGTMVMAGAIIGAHAQIGLGCILNPNAVADHDSIMEDYSHLGVGAVMAGTSVLKTGAWLRAGVALTYGDVVPERLIVEPVRFTELKSHV